MNLLARMLFSLVSALAFLVLIPFAQAQAPRYELLLKGGHVIDPANNIDAVMDVAVADGKIAAVQKDIPASSAEKVVDASGLYVTPGLIDIHVHIATGGAPLNWFDPTARSHIQPYAIPADLPLTSGVTTIVDAGTAGAESFLTEKEMVMEHSKIRVLAFLNIVANGMSGGLEQDVDEMDVKRCAETINKYPDLIVGVKTAHYWTDKPWDGEHQPWTAVDNAIACAAATNRPVMYDFWPRPDRTYADLILKKARPGDIHTHVFAQQFPIILPDGKVNPIMFEARQRGVFFDVGHGAGSFWFRNAVPAVKQGFLPDSISTDLHIENYTILSYDNVLSKFASMGVPLADLIKRATVNPANEIHRPELGTLSVGKEADIAVLQVDHGKFGFIDCGWARMDGDTNITARMTVRAGHVVFDPSGLSMVEWTKARKQYFTSPVLGGDKPSTADDFPHH
jgi:dihydroorotase